MFTKTCLCVNVFHMKNIPLNMSPGAEADMFITSTENCFLKKWTNKVCTSSLNDGKNLCYVVCLLSKPSGRGF